MGSFAQARAVVLLLIGCLLVGMFVGCSRQGVSKSNYDKLEEGMTMEEVQDLLGEGQKAAGAAGGIGGLFGKGEAYEWESEDGKAKIRVVFTDGKVSAFSQEGL